MWRVHLCIWDLLKWKMCKNEFWNSTACWVEVRFRVSVTLKVHFMKRFTERKHLTLHKPEEKKRKRERESEREKQLVVRGLTLSLRLTHLSLSPALICSHGPVQQVSVKPLTPLIITLILLIHRYEVLYLILCVCQLVYLLVFSVSLSFYWIYAMINNNLFEHQNLSQFSQKWSFYHHSLVPNLCDLLFFFWSQIKLIWRTVGIKQHWSPLTFTVWKIRLVNEDRRFYHFKSESDL